MSAACDVTRDTSCPGTAQRAHRVEPRREGHCLRLTNLPNVLQHQFDFGHSVPVPEDRWFKGPARCHLDAVTAHLSPLDRTNAMLGILKKRFFKSKKTKAGRVNLTNCWNDEKLFISPLSLKEGRVPGVKQVKG